MTLTEVRRALKDALSEIENAGVKVGIAASEYLQPTEQFQVCVLVGPPSEESEARLDELLIPTGESSVKEALESHPQLSVHVVKHAGYRIYPQPGGQQALGSEWTVDVVT